MNHSVYLPDEISERAKDEELPFSRLFRAAVEAELDRREQLAVAADGMVGQVIDFTDRNGEPTRLRFTGRHLESGDALDIYLTDTGRVVIVEEEGYTAFETAQEFGDWRDAYERRDSYNAENEARFDDAAVKLGLPRVVEL